MVNLNKKAFITLTFNMVVEYYNRYVHLEDDEVIDISNVEIVQYDSKNSEKSITLMVNIDPWLEYHVIFDPKAKGKKKEQFVSYVEMT